jgi:predicted dehydrogenase
MIQVGTGGFGATWCQRFLPPSIRDGLIEVVAAVDLDPLALLNARRHLELPPDRCYTDVERAFKENPADFCAIVVPPAAHEAIIDLALGHDLHVLCEKPIADTLEASVRVAAKVRDAGRKMGVTMSARFDQDKTSLRHELRSGRYGAISYLVLRLTCNCRTFGSWGRLRHEIPDPLLIEGAVHHLDILADLIGADCELIYTEAWNPSWGEYAGPSQALVTMRFENGCRAFYEGSKTNAAGLNDWTNEYIRAECELATLILNHRRIERFHYEPDGAWATAREGSGEPVPLLRRDKWSHLWLIQQFIEWLDGGEPMETNVEDNLRSVGLTFAAIESGHSGLPVDVGSLLRQAQEHPDSSGAYGLFR